MTKSKPLYSLDDIASLVRERKFSTTKKVLLSLDNHGWVFEELVQIVLEEIVSNRSIFYKNDELHGNPGTFADIYKVDCEGERWYVKFYIDDDIIVLSCKPDGSNWP